MIIRNLNVDVQLRVRKRSAECLRVDAVHPEYSLRLRRADLTMCPWWLKRCLRLPF